MESLEAATAPINFRASAVIIDRFDCVHDPLIQERRTTVTLNYVSSIPHLLASAVIVYTDVDQLFCARRGAATVDRGIRRTIARTAVITVASIEHYPPIQRYKS